MTDVFSFYFVNPDSNGILYQLSCLNSMISVEVAEFNVCHAQSLGGENIKYRSPYIFYVVYLHKRWIVFSAHLNSCGIKKYATVSSLCRYYTLLEKLNLTKLY